MSVRAAIVIIRGRPLKPGDNAEFYHTLPMILMYTLL
jgi:hypothetical protein